MPNVLPFYGFLKTNDLKRLPFLAKHPDPFLYFLNLPELEMSEEESKTLVVPPGIAVEDVGQQALAPVRKGGNDLEVITFGRGLDADIVVPDVRVSKLHGYLERIKRTWHLTDNGSTNGIQVDGERIEAKRPVPLKSGSRFVISDALHVVFLEPEDLHTEVQRARARMV